MVGDLMVEMDRKWVMEVLQVLVPMDLVSKIFHQNQACPVKNPRRRGRTPLNSNPLCPYSSKEAPHGGVTNLYNFKFLARECQVLMLFLLKLTILVLRAL